MKDTLTKTNQSKETLTRFAEEFNMYYQKAIDAHTSVNDFKLMTQFSPNQATIDLEKECDTFSALYDQPISHDEQRRLFDYASHLKLGSLFEPTQLAENLSQLKLAVYRYINILHTLDQAPELFNRSEEVELMALTFLQNTSKKLDRYSYRLEQVYGGVYGRLPLLVHNTVTGLVRSAKGLFTGKVSLNWYGLSLKKDIDYLNFVIKGVLRQA